MGGVGQEDVLVRGQPGGCPDEERGEDRGDDARDREQRQRAGKETAHANEDRYGLLCRRARGDRA
jgi:hypothetical protein